LTQVKNPEGWKTPKRPAVEGVFTRRNLVTLVVVAFSFRHAPTGFLQPRGS
jgi:hypothetical protein